MSLLARFFQGFIPIGLIAGIGLVALTFAAAFFAGSIEPILNVLLARYVPAERRGAAFGLAGSARTAGWSIGARIGGGLSAAWGFSSVFVFSAVMFAVTAVSLRRLERATPPDSPSAPAGGPTDAGGPPGAAPGRRGRFWRR